MDYNLAVIGAGWAGFNAALKAKALGLKVAVIDKGAVGGTCLNRGCIPTKTLIHSAKAYSLVKKSRVFGIETNEPRFDFPSIQARKDKIVGQLRKGMEFMLKGIDFISGQARVSSGNTIEVNGKKLNSEFIIIASGSRPMELPGFELDGKKFISSEGALELKKAPASLLVIGGGVIGCEFANLFSSLGSEVTIIELTPQLLPGTDKEIAKKLETVFKKRGIRVCTSTDAKSADLSIYERALVCVGRSSETQGLGLQELGIKLEKGRVLTDDFLRTAIPGIYAAGDCTSKIMLAHFAAYQGCVAAENAAGPANPRKCDTANIPSCIFTEPQIGTVGISEDQALLTGREIKIDKFDFMGSGMARILEETDGFIKIISDKKTGEIMGASIIGPGAAELIGILTVAVQTGIKTDRLRDAILAHPTLSEGITGALKEGYGL